MKVKLSEQSRGDGMESLDEDVSSDEEFERNRVGDIPLEWYDDFDHVGRDVSGQKIIKSDEFNGDNIDKLLKSRDDPMFRRTIFDYKNQQSIVLTNRELNLVRRMIKGRFVSETSTFEAHPEYKAYYSGKVLDMPLNYDKPLSKRRFLPSIAEKRKIMQLIRDIRAGKIKMSNESEEKPSNIYANYILWDKPSEGEEPLMNLSQRRKRRHIPAPKTELPGHSLSYHPPPEYLFDEEEQKKYEELSDQEKQSLVKPEDFGKLRYVPSYENIVREQFERCLDLYLCTRVKKNRLNIDPESLVPKLPLPKELRPFPNLLALSYFGHTGQVRSISVSKSGSILASADSKGFIKLWDVESTRCLKTIDVSQLVGDKNLELSQVRINPKFALVAVACAPFIIFVDISDLLNPGDKLAIDALNDVLKNTPTDQKNEKSNICEWRVGKQKHGVKERYLQVEILDKSITEIKKLVWHPKGLYLTSVTDSSARKKIGQLHIHHIIKKRSQKLLPASHSASSLDIQCICFHPTKSVLFIATKQNIFSYDLLQRKSLKRIKAGSKWVSSLKVHSSGDHLLIGGYDKYVNWVDLDLKDEPFKAMKFHAKAVRAVDFHPRYPLMVSASDDGSLHMFHARAYDDLMRNPMIVPVKKLRAHYIVAEVGVFEVAFHPTQPWVFSCGGDGNIHLFQNVS